MPSDGSTYPAQMKISRLYRYTAQHLSGDALERGVTVAIPTWNGAHLLSSCIKSIRAQSLRPREILVVDNGSTDGTRELIYQFSDVRMIELPVNRGYSGAVTAALKETRTTLLAVVNNDVAPESEWLHHLVRTMNRESHLGAVFPISLDARGRVDTSGDVPTRAGFYYRRGYRMEPAALSESENYLLLAPGVAPLYAVRALIDVGGWDVGLHSFYEDVDLSLRLHMAGWGIRFVPESRVIHEQGSTASHYPSSVEFLSSRNEEIVFWKKYAGSCSNPDDCFQNYVSHIDTHLPSIPEKGLVLCPRQSRVSDGHRSGAYCTEACRPQKDHHHEHAAG